MPDSERRPGLVPALLKQWRARRGLSQLDLAVAADVSARHISFIETGRSVPSPEMVMLLGSALGIPLSQVNTMLVAAGHEPVFEESPDSVPHQVARALGLLKAHHEPFPLIVVDDAYGVVDLNHAAWRLLGALLGLSASGAPPTPAQLAELDLNLARLTFDPAGAQPHLANFDEVGRQLLWRIHREVLADPGNDELRELLEDLLEMPTVSPRWREVDLGVRSDPALVLHLRSDDLELRFLTTVTAFQAPQNVAVEELRIEHWFPYDDETASICRALASDGP
ncbi:MAG: helix-turn-helix domain-containing protein [Microthrixaceae bacterium]